ncbi:type I polyketide synthase [Nocardiopsis changdeensis]|uniref:type I polyketide synthase n=1 Tax=Nocardiopsis changdeensis TaxID=2831969 RepID=UPI0024082F22|nr:type I polyketide synthase [Nocardiopsis changdeensis]
MVGISCRLPGAPDPDSFWRLLSEGREAIVPPPDRLGPAPAERGPGWGGYLDDVFGFDAEFFGISPREAEAMDPQQRLMLELSREAVEHARIAPGSLRGTRVGVFVGAIAADHALLYDRAGRDALTRHSLTGTHRSLIAHRVSHTLGLRGPSMTLDAGQASSLVSVHSAVQSLRSGESDAALAGGVSLILVPEGTEAVSRFGGLSPQARCHTFDARADGYVRGEGGAVVMLKPLARALADGDRIHALVHGGAVNHSGGGGFLTRPTPEGQAEVIRAALEDAGQRPDRVGHVELHGTGTPVGDPVEARALGEVFAPGRTDPLRVGSAKTNVGHLEGAAGIVGFVKTVLALEHRTLPPSLNFSEPHPDIDLEALHLSVQTADEPWPAHAPLAGVSAFAMGGANCHLVLGPAPLPEPGAAEHRSTAGPRVLDPVPWVLSARSQAALREQASALHAHVSSRTGTRPQDVGFSLATTRDVFEHRAVVFASDEGGAGELETVLHDGRSGFEADTAGPVLVFPGQGGQWAGMGRGLLSGDGVLARAFARRIRQCERALAPHVDWSLTAVLRGDPEAPGLVGPGAGAEVVQPALWAVMVSLARAWEVLGVRPAAVVGHSQGELAAACVAGALSLEEAARVVALRSRALRELAGSGAMASLGVAEAEARVLTEDLPDLYVAAVNGPHAVVVSGDPESVREAVRRCTDKGLHGALVDVDYASHSVHVERVRATLFSQLGTVRWRRPRVPFYSTLTGGAPGADPLPLDAAYWYTGLREPVRFAAAVAALADAGHRTFLEVGPHPVLSHGIRSTLVDRNVQGRVLETLRRGEDDEARLLTAAARAFTAGIDIDWAVLFEGTDARRTDLPTYPFQRERFGPPPAPAPSPAVEDTAENGTGAWLDPGVELVDGRTVFTARLDPAGLPWLRDHRLFGRAVLPAAALAALVQDAGATVGAGVVSDLLLEEPLVLPGGDREVEAQVTVGAADDRGDREVTVHTRGSRAWIRHARGHLAADGPEGARAAVATTEATSADTDPDEAYTRLAEQGRVYGPRLRGLRQVFHRKDTLLARVAVPREAGPSPAGLHPVLLESALHTALLYGPGTDGPLLTPVSWRGLRVREDADPVEVSVELERLGPDRYRVIAQDTGGVPVLSVDEVTLAPIQAQPLPPAPGDEPELYRLSWQPVPAPGPLGAVPLDLPSLDTLDRDGPVPEVVYAELPARAVYADHGAVPEAVREGLATALASVRRWLGDARFAHARLALVTWRAVVTGPDDRVSGLAAAPVWGLLRSVQREFPGRLVLVDSDGSENSHRVLPGAVRSGHPQSALRAGQVLVPRLVRAVDGRHPVPPAASWRLGTREPGALHDLAFLEVPVVRPGTGQVRVAVRAAGTTHRDVAVGLGLRDDRTGAGMGIEGAGVVVEVGPGVEGLSVGDRVAGVFTGAFGPMALADHRCLVPIPDTWDFAEAAAVPVAFLTAYHALVNVAAVRPGESVLVHSAAGGVGMAAVQLAHHMGAKVFGTASPHKWPALREIGLPEERLASSRDPGFEHTLRRANGGRGLDVVLNSLTGELADASLRLLRSPADGAGPGGRFVELGAEDARSESDVSADHPGRTYLTFDLLEVEPERIGQMLARVMELLATGVVRPIPVNVRDIRDAGEAFTALRRGDTVGRTVLSLPDPFPAGTTVLITGGTGALGHRLARHLVGAYGVGHLTLVGRRGAAAPGQDSRTAELRSLGAEVQVKACDAADRASLERLLAGLDRPLGAVVHTADVVDGAGILEGDPQRLEEVLRAKVDAAWNLHELTADRDLGSFLLFTSAGGVLGAPGRSHHAAAAVYSDALAHYRRERGLPAVSLAWGLWGDPEEGGPASDEATAGGVLRPMPPDRALAKFDAALYLDRDALVPALLDAHGPDLPLLHGLIPSARGRRRAVRDPRPPMVPVERTAPSRAPGSHALGPLIPGTLASLAAHEREKVLLAEVRARTAEVLGHSGTGGVPDDRAFRDLGLDSMGGVELRNRLARATGLDLPPTAVFDHPTPRALARFLAQIAAPLPAEAPPSDPARGETGDPAYDDIDDMGVDELLNLAMGSMHDSRPDGEQETADGYR